MPDRAVHVAVVGVEPSLDVADVVLDRTSRCSVVRRRRPGHSAAFASEERDPFGETRHGQISDARCEDWVGLALSRELVWSPWVLNRVKSCSHQTDYMPWPGIATTARSCRSSAAAIASR